MHMSDIIIKWFMNLGKKRRNPNIEYISNTRNDSNKNTIKKITVIRDSMVKFLRANEMSSVNNAINVMKHSGYTADTMVDYVRPVTRKKPDVIIIHVGMTGLIKGVNMMSKVRKIVSIIQEVDSTEISGLVFIVLTKEQTKIIVKKLKISILG